MWSRCYIPFHWACVRYLPCLVSNPLLTDDDDLIDVTLSDDIVDDVADVVVGVQTIILVKILQSLTLSY